LLGPRRPARHREPHRLRHVHVADLSTSMYTGIGPPGHREPRRFDAQHPFQSGLELALNRPAARLRGPAGEVGAVVGDVEAQTQQPAGPRLGNGGLHAGRPGQALPDESSSASASPASASAASALSLSAALASAGSSAAPSASSTAASASVGSGLDSVASAAPAAVEAAAALCPAARRVALVASVTTCSASGSTSSMIAIGALSPLRGPIFTIRV